MKIAVVFFITSLFAMNLSAQTLELSPRCQAFLLANKKQIEKDTKALRAGLEHEFKNSSYGNGPYAVVVVATFMFNNPYAPIRHVENGMYRLEKGKPLTHRQVEVLSGVCENDGEISLTVLTQH